MISMVSKVLVASEVLVSVKAPPRASLTWPKPWGKHSLRPSRSNYYAGTSSTRTRSTRDGGATNTPPRTLTDRHPPVSQPYRLATSAAGVSRKPNHLFICSFVTLLPRRQPTSVTIVADGKGFHNPLQVCHFTHVRGSECLGTNPT